MNTRGLPRLEIVPLRRLILHEDVEEHRVARIVERLGSERTLRNPPIVGRNPQELRLIVLDGASRVSAARRMGFPHLLVQVVPYPSAAIGLDRWHHLVAGMSLDGLCERASGIEGVALEGASWRSASRALETRRILACFRSPGKKTVVLRGTPPGKLHPIRELVRLYATDPGLHRVREDQLRLPGEWLGEDHVFVLFPRFRQEDIVRFALRLEERLPMGITRHTVPNRALRVHYPVSRLRARRPLGEKRRHLEAFLEERWQEGRIRHYPEATTLYDE